MFKIHPIRNYLKYAVIAALLYSIFAFVFIRKDDFSFSWILFIGNFLFAIVIGFFVFTYNIQRKENFKSLVMIMAGHITAIIGILISFVIIFLLFIILDPTIFHVLPVNPSSLENAPPTLQGNGHGFMLVLFMNATFGNISAASFLSIILSLTAKRYKTP